MFALTQRKIGREARVLLTVHGLSSVLRSFSKIFLGIYFLKVTQWNMGSVALFYAIFYLTNAVFFYFIGNQIKSRDKLVSYRVGILFYLIFVLLIVLLKENVGQYILYLAILFGIADGFYWLPYNVLKFELNSYSDRSLFFGYEKALEDLIKIAVPVIIGILISYGSYQPIFVIVLAITGLSYLISFRVTSPKALPVSMDVKGFLELLKKKDEVDVIRTYRSEFLRGINYIGALEIVIPIIVFLSFSSEFALGVLTSVFALVSVLTSIVIGKFLKDKHFRFSIIISGIVLFLGSLLLVFNVSRASIIVYNIIFSLTIPVLNILQTVYSYNSIDKGGLVDFKVEHLIVREAFRNGGRVLGFIFLFIVSIFGSDLNMIRVVLVVLSLSILLISVEARKLRM